jgi:LDH2 family malate/lactate/ureidoglycolate dehydrogenase
MGAEVLLRWSDVVVSSGERGDERLLLAGADLEVHAGETVWLAVPDPRTRTAVVGILDGSRRPLYGRREGVAAPAVRNGRSAADVALVVVPEREAVLSSGTGFGEDLDERRATVVVAAEPPAGPDAAVATRCLHLIDGALRPAPRSQRWPVDIVTKAVVDRLVAAGTGPETATVVADVLVDANVRGHDSHGVQLLPMYLDRLAAGGIDATAQPRWLRDGTSISVLSASGGFGQPAARAAAERCAQMAAEHGLAAVSVRDNNHVGMLAAYRRPFLDAGVVALILNISGPSVAAPNARRATLGNDAVCLVAPRGAGRPPLIADFATGAVASGKIRDAAVRGRRVPDGWLVGPDGRPSTDPADLDRGGAVPVFGGAGSGHKGLCVAVITEVLAGMIAGATISPRVNKQRQHPELSMDCSQLFLGFAPDAFLAGDIDELTTALLESVAAGYQGAVPRIHFPEQLEVARTVHNLRHGVDLPHDIAAVLGLAE